LRVRGLLLLSQMASYGGTKELLLQQGALQGAFYALTGHAGCPGGEQLATQVHTLFQLLTLSCSESLLPPMVGDGIFGHMRPDETTVSSSSVRHNAQHGAYLQHQCVDIIVNGFKEFLDTTSRLYSALTLANLLCSRDESVVAAVRAAKGDVIVKFVPLTGGLEALPSVPGPLQTCETLLGIFGLLECTLPEVRAFGRHALRVMLLALQKHSSEEAKRISNHWRTIAPRDAAWLGWAKHFGRFDESVIVLAIASSATGPVSSAAKDSKLDTEVEGVTEWLALLSE
jgi:hypothetical protein